MGAVKNLEGLQFNRLFVLGYDAFNDFTKRTKWVCLCQCQNIVNVIGSQLINGKTKSCGCWFVEFHKSKTGSKNPMFGKIGPMKGRTGVLSPNFGKKGRLSPLYGRRKQNRNISKIERDRYRPEIKEWRATVYDRDNYTCQKCGCDKSGSLNAHHIVNFAEDTELRFAIDNGMTLCKNCHTNFHKTYGYRKNTKNQLSEWINIKENESDICNGCN